MKYLLTARITVSAYCEVEADSPEEAMKKAEYLPPAHHSYNTGTEPETHWCVEEIDGEPMDITIEEA